LSSAFQLGIPNNIKNQNDQVMLITTKSFTLAINAKGDPNSEKLALVLPGKLDTKDYAHMTSHVDYLSKLGYFALSFDPPGTWESPGDISLYNTTNYLKAVNELMEHFGNKPTFVMGHSRGGSMAMLAGTTNPHVTAFAAIMAYSYIRSYKEPTEEDWKKTGYITSMRDLPPGGGSKVKRFDLPYSFLEDQKQYVIGDKLKESTKPKLFISGKQDVTVSPEKIREAYELASQPKELYELNSDHNYRLHTELIEEVNKVVGDFLRKYKQI
jgi:pimeloyl-ACP methyl ester carboxylesterase